MIKITKQPILPEQVIARVITRSCGCVVTYTGVIRDSSQGKSVLTVEYSETPEGITQKKLQRLANETKSKWSLEGIAIYHRIGKLNVGDLNLVVAVASKHRQEGFMACQFIIDQFKTVMPTKKLETYTDGTTGINSLG